MKSKIILLFLVPFFIGCAAYSKLDPDPEISSIEDGYIELKDDDEWFELEKGDKYYIEFPAPLQDDFYLVLQFNDKSMIQTSFASRFDDKDGAYDNIPDEAPTLENQEVYPAGRNVQKFYWIIERVQQDFALNMTYRYLPVWRYKFETQYEAFQQILQENSVDRTTYENIGGSISLNNFNYNRALNELDVKTNELKNLQGQLSDIEKIIPANIRESADPAYRSYLTLKEDISVELAFQENYSNTLKLFQLEQKTRTDMAAFNQALPEFAQFFENKERYPQNVVDEARRVFEARLDEMTPHFDDYVERKNDWKPVPFDAQSADALYQGINITPPAAYKTLSGFVKEYNSKADKVVALDKQLADIKNRISVSKQWPGNAFFSSILSEASGLKKEIPAAGFSDYGKYNSTNAVRLLNNKIYELRNTIIRSEKDYRDAQNVVAQLNRYAASNSYDAMMQLLNQRRDLDFLIDMYADLDNKYLQQQKRNISRALKQQNFSSAESALRSLHLKTSFLKPRSIANQKTLLVRTLEDSLINSVERVTRQKVNQFVAEKYVVLDNVEQLYNDPVFLPAHNITFTSGSQSELQRRKQALEGRLKSLKEVEFPSKAIEFLYRDFSANINDNGVKKARAIVTHGRFYKGSDNKIKNLVAECDPWASKWLTRETQFRKLYAIPTTTNPAGENTYVFRVNIRIPTDARFPVYDVEIKLPREVAAAAGQKQWYEEITMNKKLLKNEGRFMITAPNSQNDYTALITPLQTEPQGDSVLEVRFKHNSYKVFEVSVMAQKPILRKN